MKLATMVLATVAILMATVEAQAQRRFERGGPQPGMRMQMPNKAIAVLHGLGENHIKGIVTFTMEGGTMLVKGEITGLKPGEHAFHVHEFGDCSAPDGSSAGAHFNPRNSQHGGPHAMPRHVGDLGNIKADDSGKAVVDIKIDQVNPFIIVGRSLIVHADPDDFKTQPSGNAGGRIACAVIGWAKPESMGPATAPVATPPKSVPPQSK